ncbi:uncharacterized protein LOC128956501 [Oppia nitens]|uniref:uncharacterized protein LOC128956501 n=1 Tax=Oppia nitens TaxID=1686743 RepID=UPI0023DB092F|nr:uncharacterized protein LOC128956501 [Oppia nitens]
MDDCRRVFAQMPCLLADISADTDHCQQQQDNTTTTPVIEGLEPYVRQIRPTFADIYSRFSGQQWQRFVDAWIDYADGNVASNAVIAENGRFGSLDEFWRIRRQTIGTLITTMIIMYTDADDDDDNDNNNLELPERDWLDPRMQQLLELTKDHMICSNDLFSFEKELLAISADMTTTIIDGTDRDRHALAQMSNIVAMTAIDRQCSISEAQLIIVELFDKLDGKIIELVRDWEQCNGGQPLSPGARQFIRGLLYFLGGMYRTNTNSDRYHRLYHT